MARDCLAEEKVGAVGHQHRTGGDSELTEIRRSGTIAAKATRTMRQLHDPEAPATSSRGAQRIGICVCADAEVTTLCGCGARRAGEMRNFEEGNRGDLESFLIELTANILRVKDPERASRWGSNSRQGRQKGKREKDHGGRSTSALCPHIARPSHEDTFRAQKEHRGQQAISVPASQYPATRAR